MDIEKIYIIVSTVTLLCALASPTITAIVNNRYQLKLRQLELTHSDKTSAEQHQHDIVEKYLMSAGAAAYVFDSKTASEYGKYYALAFAYLPNECHEQMKKFNSVLRFDNLRESRQEYEKLAIIVKSYIRQ